MSVRMYCAVLMQTVLLAITQDFVYVAQDMKEIQMTSLWAVDLSLYLALLILIVQLTHIVMVEFVEVSNKILFSKFILHIFIHYYYFLQHHVNQIMNVDYPRLVYKVNVTILVSAQELVEWTLNVAVLTTLSNVAVLLDLLAIMT